MLQPYYAEISVARTDPPSGFDHENAAKQVARKFERLAAKIVSRSLLKSSVDPKKKAQAEKRVVKIAESEARQKAVQGFLDLWNKWREFYFDLGPVRIKNRSQLTAIENAIEFANEHNMNLSVLIACIHRAYLKRTFRPNFTAVTLYGEEIYERMYDAVESDIAERDRAEAAAYHGGIEVERWTCDEDEIA